ncbi:Putative exopolyphosphatase [Fulvia fulva]|uniref:Exopolyphosphatase n=1 Tax=Passalora fulva TaxID=5499 RepID=A0A9Q8PB06_PASFU|nr:Putative exopolyphosphatase [Fulvia fulva]KAK4621592.1 putative exopolyphosphatase [Fulvia fulva]KAK4623242.1 putative exopolyphosphatase [Fulvia fulva]UJO19127.1 Putative exopolyphosphatase [Fulvia fulva]WPV16392.1 Putative exopolyphosphatase [Fulvia fulva]WPV30821.1 Putative exopolyphosphatase [Fulvia fulva]
MSRLSIRAYLSAARRHLQKCLIEKSHTSFVIGNESADLDSITCALIYGYLLSERPEVKRSGSLVIPVTNIPAADLQLRPELTALLKHADIKPSELITLDDIGTDSLSADKTSWTLVDHNSLQGKLGELYRSRVIGVVDHHDDEHTVSEDAQPRIITKTGSCQSLVINHLRDTWQKISDSAMTVGAAHPQNNETLVDDHAYTSTWDAQAAKIALGAILIDTVDLKAEHKVTEHDKKAFRFLEAKINISRKYGKDYDRDRFFTEIDDAKSNLDGLSLEDILRKDYKQWTEGDLTLGISSCVQPISYLTEKGKEFQGSLKAFAKSKSLDLFVIMPAFKEGGNFQREILLMTLSEKGNAAAERFAKSGQEELELEDKESSALGKDDEIKSRYFWNQKNLDASRKRVGPLLREAMKG